MLALMLGILAAAAPQAQAAATPAKVVSPLTVTSQPKTSPPVDVTVQVGGDEDSAGSQDVSIWPASAYEARATGHVTLTCRVDVHGLAESCRVAYEAPQGRGFGKAALALRPTLKLDPAKGPDGQPVARLMNIGLVFRAPDMEMTTTPMADSMTGRAANVEVSHNPLPMRRVTLMTDPVWARAPSFDDLARVYPREAAGAEGYVVAHCGVTHDGYLKDCSVAKELPTRRGFGAAALKLAPQFRVMPQIMARAPGGAPVEVDVPVRFAPPGPERTVTAPTWLVGFDPEAAPKLFPPEAAAKGLTSGRGVARCRVAEDGSVQDCAPETADPDGLGFSEAAAKLASTMKMNLWSADAGPVEGGIVHVAIRLNLRPGTP
ncbi:MAG TPA: energy transducer TonB [Phenylobacterium sp.]|uniref:energy transducer TonB family protein n=1 Tax=Phenylobacterium sp. TaxID=1871053 RepID=UPI002BC71DA5|nr:energy transducer TonB [Phenylobacterium sp.]HSV03287.1 energy transducer TonB [Phenylobacterium sp.]